MTESSLGKLFATLPQTGRVQWIGVRPARGEPMCAMQRVFASAASGILGDRYQGRPGGKRQITLLQHEHLGVISGCLNAATISPADLRRNIIVSGINLLALKNKRFRIGEALLEMTGPCHPCSKMERTLGPGGYNAMRGHGGITARVVEDGEIGIGDSVRVERLVTGDPQRERMALTATTEQAMALDKPYTDVPGTTIFDAEQSRLGYWLNQFCMSLMSADNRERFKADERTYLDEWAMSEAQKQAVLDRDLNRCIALGGNIYFLAKLGATLGKSFQQMAGSMTGMSEQEYRDMMVSGGRSVEGNRYVGEDGDAQSHRQPQGNGQGTL